MTVKGHGGFEAEGVAGAQAGGFEDGGIAVLLVLVIGEEFHGHAGGGVAENEFHAVFAGVAGANDCEGDHHHVALDFKVVAFEITGWIREEGIEHFDDFGALEGDHGGSEGFVFDFDVGWEVAFEVGEDLFAVGGVADHEPVAAVVIEAGDDDVVENAAGFIADEGVKALAFDAFGDVAGD